MIDLNNPFWDISHFLDTFVERLAAENILIIFCSSSWKQNFLRTKKVMSKVKFILKPKKSILNNPKLRITWFPHLFDCCDYRKNFYNFIESENYIAKLLAKSGLQDNKTPKNFSKSALSKAEIFQTNSNSHGGFDLDLTNSNKPSWLCTGHQRFIKKLTGTRLSNNWRPYPLSDNISKVLKEIYCVIESFLG